MAVVTRFITKNAECVLKDEACVKLQMNGVGNNILILHWLNYLLLFFLTVTYTMFPEHTLFRTDSC